MSEIGVRNVVVRLKLMIFIHHVSAFDIVLKIFHYEDISNMITSVTSKCVCYYCFRIAQKDQKIIPVSGPLPGYLIIYSINCSLSYLLLYW